MTVSIRIFSDCRLAIEPRLLKSSWPSLDDVRGIEPVGDVETAWRVEGERRLAELRQGAAAGTRLTRDLPARQLALGNSATASSSFIPMRATILTTPSIGTKRR
jgi:Putative addiction module component